MKILYLEDSAADADLTRRALAQADPSHVVEVASTLAAARELLGAHPDFDLALLDLKLPDGSGMEILAHIRKRKLPLAVVMLTASGNQDSAIFALKAGADDYLVKREGYLNRLPRALTDALAHSRTQATHSSHTTRVLYAEHHLFDIELTRKHLSRHASNFMLESVGTAQEVLDRLPDNAGKASKYDVLLLDYRLPDLDGLELIKLLRQERRLAVPIVLVTGHGSAELAVQALRLGADDYLVKHADYLSELPPILTMVCQQAELVRGRAALHTSEAHIKVQSAALMATANPIVTTDRDAVIEWANPAFTTLTGYSLDEALGKRPKDLTRSGVQSPAFYQAMWNTILSGQIWHGEVVNKKKDGSLYHEELTITPVTDASGEIAHFVAVKQDVSERIQAQQLQSARNAVLDHIISRNPLPAILDDIARQLEAFRPDSRVSILLLGTDGRLSVGAAPSLPDFFNYATEGLEIGYGMGACGTAAWSGEPVIAEDLQTHPYCVAFRDFAAQAGLRACWSYPFKDAASRVLGTFAVYHSIPCNPCAREQALIAEFARLAGLAVQRVREEAARQATEVGLRQREQALDMAAHATLELLRGNDLDAAIGRVLHRVGQEIDVDRVYLFENHPDADSGRILTSQRYEWAREGISVQIDNPGLQSLPFEDTFGRWLTALGAGQVIKGRVADFPASERALLAPQDILSLLVVPISLDNRLWGFLGFDSVQRLREWNAAEESVLRIVAASLGAAILRKRSQAAMQRAAAVFESTQEGVIVTDLAARIQTVNPAFVEISGYSEAECLGHTPNLLNSGHHDEAFFRVMWASVREVGHWHGEIWNRRKDGTINPQLLTISAVHDAHGTVTGYVGMYTDISQIKQSQERLEHLAHYDPLTDLPNRLLVSARLDHALRVADRSKDHVAVLFIDLDQFKTINDSLGHEVGDELLVAVARRMTGRLREEDTFGRLGGDEFVIILERLKDVQDAAPVALDLIQSLQAPFLLNSGHEVYIRASIGISLFPDDGESSTELIRNADAAMYRAKNQGRNTYGFYTEDLTRAASQRLTLETRLRQALKRQEFVLHYQPLISLSDGRVVGAEALVRWQPPDGPQVPPNDFIPLAEDTGLIVPLGEWVLDTACRQGKAWLDAGLPLETMAVNMSVRQFQRRDIGHCLNAVLTETGLPPGCLELEITETGIMAQGERAVQALSAIKERGIRLAIDDFGTGYSSLSYLKRLPLDTLKIDRSFVSELPHDPNDTAIAATIIAMARTLGLKVLAEGVETQAQHDFLKDQGCDYCQGYLFGPGVPAEEFAARFWTEYPAAPTGT